MNTNDVVLKFYKPEDLAKLNYDLELVQEQFTSSVTFALDRIAGRELETDLSGYPVTIFCDSQPVGFFVLDTGKDKAEIAENPQAILLRSLSINPEFQSKGIGNQTIKILPNFVTAHFPHSNEIVLTVNINNNLARRIYLNEGYLFSSKTKMGRNGLQDILTKKI